MKYFKKTAAVLLALLMLTACFTVSAGAEDDALLMIELMTDKDTYELNDVANIMMHVINPGETAANNVVIQCTLSDGFYFANGMSGEYMVECLYPQSDAMFDVNVAYDPEYTPATDTDSKPIDHRDSDTEGTDVYESDTDSMNDKNVMAGDVDGDGAVKMGDVTLLQRYIAGLESLNATQKSAALVGGEKDINMSCVTYIQRMIAGLVRDDWTRTYKSSADAESARLLNPRSQYYVTSNSIIVDFGGRECEVTVLVTFDREPLPEI